MNRGTGTTPRNLPLSTPRYPFVTLSDRRLAEVVTTLRRTLAYLPDNAAIECDVRALLEALEERRDT